MQSEDASLETEIETENKYCDEIELFDEASQKKYLTQLRLGLPVRIAAREIGFTPRVVRELRKRNSLFNEACEENIAEAEELVEWEARKAAQLHQPWAVRLLAERQGWKRESLRPEGGASNMSELVGNPIERILKLQDQVTGRYQDDDEPEDNEELLLKKRKRQGRRKKRQPVIDVSLADE